MFVPGPFATRSSPTRRRVIKVEPPRATPGAPTSRCNSIPESQQKKLALDLKSSPSRDCRRLVKKRTSSSKAFGPVSKTPRHRLREAEDPQPGNHLLLDSGYGQTARARARARRELRRCGGRLAFRASVKPRRSSYPVPTWVARLAAIAVLAALHEGKSAYLDLSLFEAAFFMAAMRHSLDRMSIRAHLFPSTMSSTPRTQRLTLASSRSTSAEPRRIVPELADDGLPAIRSAHERDALSARLPR